MRPKPIRRQTRFECIPATHHTTGVSSSGKARRQNPKPICDLWQERPGSHCLIQSSAVRQRPEPERQSGPSKATKINSKSETRPTKMKTHKETHPTTKRKRAKACSRDTHSLMQTSADLPHPDPSNQPTIACQKLTKSYTRPTNKQKPR